VDERRRAAGQQIKAARRRAGHRSQRAFADAIGVHESSVANAERGDESVGDAVFQAIEAGLGWAPGSIRAYIDGDERVALPGAVVALESTDLPASDDGGIDQEMYDYLMLVKATMDESNASLELKNRLIMSEYALWRPRVPDATKFLRTWLRWVNEMNTGDSGTESDDPYRTG
jgi:transcriptional regulator with XRE-family HTH domain